MGLRDEHFRLNELDVKPDFGQSIGRDRSSTSTVFEDILRVGE